MIVDVGLLTHYHTVLSFDDPEREAFLNTF